MLNWRPNNCIFTKAPYLEGGEIVLYTKNWQTGILDISTLPNNEEFTIEFTTARCGLMGHFGYTYIDDLCIVHSDENIQGSIRLDPLYKICPALPISVCGNYTVPNSGGVTATVSSIKLDVYEGTNPTPVYTTTTTSSHDTANKRFALLLLQQIFRILQQEIIMLQLKSTMQFLKLIVRELLSQVQAIMMQIRVGIFLS